MTTRDETSEEEEDHDYLMDVEEFVPEERQRHKTNAVMAAINERTDHTLLKKVNELDQKEALTPISEWSSSKKFKRDELLRRFYNMCIKPPEFNDHFKGTPLGMYLKHKFKKKQVGKKRRRTT